MQWFCQNRCLKILFILLFFDSFPNPNKTIKTPQNMAITLIKQSEKAFGDRTGCKE